MAKSKQPLKRGKAKKRPKSTATPSRLAAADYEVVQVWTQEGLVRCRLQNVRTGTYMQFKSIGLARAVYSKDRVGMRGSNVLSMTEDRLRDRVASVHHAADPSHGEYNQYACAALPLYQQLLEDCGLLGYWVICKGDDEFINSLAIGKPNGMEEAIPDPFDISRGGWDNLDFLGVTVAFFMRLMQENTSPQKPLERPVIFLAGNLSDGFDAVGPFASMDEAAREAMGREGWLLTCKRPNGDG